MNSKIYGALLFAFFILMDNQMFAQTVTNTNSKTTSTTTVTKDGKVVSYSHSESGGNGSNKKIKNSWSQKDGLAEKRYTISANAPIFIESKMRNINILTWDEPDVKIVAKYKYSDDKDANLDLDSLFSKNDIQIKSGKNAFQILAGGNDNISYRTNYSYSPSNFSFGQGMDADSLRNLAKMSQKLALTNLKLASAQHKLSAQEHGKASKEREKNYTEQIKKMTAELAAAAKENDQKKIESLSAEIGKLSTKLANNEVKKGTIIINGKSLEDFIGDNLSSIDTTVFSGMEIDSDDFSDIPTPPTPNVYISPDSRTIYLNDFKTSSTNGKEWTIYIPKNHKINIESKYGNIKIAEGVDNVKIINKYGNVETENLKHLQLSQEYGNYSGGNLEDADIEIKNGRVKAKNIENLNLNSKYSNIDLDDVENAKITSVSDNMDVNAFNSLNADKNYGSLRMASLGKSLVLSGNSADLKIRSLAPTVTNIDIDNKYANISIPMEDLNDYSVVLNGNYNTTNDNFTNKKSLENKSASNVSFPLQNSLTTEKTKDKLLVVNKDNGSFEAQKGNGNQLKVRLNCTSCTIDFK